MRVDLLLDHVVAAKLQAGPDDIHSVAYAVCHRSPARGCFFGFIITLRSVALEAGSVVMGVRPLAGSAPAEQGEKEKGG